MNTLAHRLCQLLAIAAAIHAVHAAETVSISADAMTGSGRNITYTGNVVLDYPGVQVRAEQISIHVQDGAGGAISSFRSLGNPVHIRQHDAQNPDSIIMTGQALRVDYERAQDQLVLMGAASIKQQGKLSLRGQEIKYNLRTGAQGQQPPASADSGEQP